MDGILGVGDRGGKDMGERTLVVTENVAAIGESLAANAAAGVAG